VVVRGVSPAKVFSGRAKFGDIFGARSMVFYWFSLDTLSSVVFLFRGVRWLLPVRLYLTVVGGDRWFRMLFVAGGHSPSSAMARALHALVPVATIPTGCFCGFLAAACIFLFVHSCLCSQFTFIMGSKLLGHFRWLVS
jgi:hypothetical protein